MKNHRGIWRLLAAAALLMLLLVLAGLLYLRWEQPPAILEELPEETRAVLRQTHETGRTEARIAAEAGIPGRKQGVYTILLAGRDEASGSTDTILLRATRS